MLALPSGLGDPATSTLERVQLHNNEYEVC